MRLSFKFRITGIGQAYIGVSFGILPLYRNRSIIVRIKKIIIYVCTALCISLMTGCGSKAEDDGKGLNIVCTIYPQYDFVMNILGEAAEGANVTYLLWNGLDMHNYQPSAEDIIRIAESDVFIYVGGESDKWVSDVLKSTKHDNMQEIALLDIIEAKEEELVPGMEHEHEDDIHGEDTPEEHGGEYDEHVWLSIKNAVTITDALCEAVSAADSANAAVYRANADVYIAELNKLDSEYEETINNAKRRTILVADRFPFRYLADDYGLEYFAAFPGCSAETEASFETIIFLANKIDEYALPVVLKLEASAGAVAETVIGAAASENIGIMVLDSMQSVTGGKIEDGYTYLKVMRKNLEVLKEALN